MFARLYSVKYIPVVIAVHLTLLLCIYHFWYSPDANSSTHSIHHFGGTENFLTADEVWLQPYDWNIETSAWPESIMDWKEAIRSSSIAPKHHNSSKTALWRFIAISRTSIHLAGHEVEQMTWHQAILKKRDEHPCTHTVVLFEQCPHAPTAITFGNIYKYYDSVAACAVHLARAFPTAALVYLAPTAQASGHVNSTQQLHHQDQLQDNSLAELELLHWHLSQCYLVRLKGLLVANNRRAMKYYSTQLGDHGQDVYLRYKDSSKGDYVGINNVQTITMRDLDVQINHIASSLEVTPHGSSNTSSSKSALARLVKHQHAKLFAATHSLHSQCAKYSLTRKYDPQCHPPSSLTHPFLVTGLGGAGTHYAARQLCMQGWRVLHEDLDYDGAVVST